MAAPVEVTTKYVTTVTFRIVGQLPQSKGGAALPKLAQVRQFVRLAMAHRPTPRSSDE